MAEHQLNAALELTIPLDALDALSSALLPLTEATEALMDERSFDIFDAAVKHACSSAACLPKAQELALALASSASAREVFTMVMEALSTHRSPPMHLLLLRTLARALPRLTRKRADFIATCLTSLSARYLDDAWPGALWDDEQEESTVLAGDYDTDQPAWSDDLLPTLLDCVAPLAGEVLDKPDADATAVRARRLVLGFLWRALELAHGAARPSDALAASTLIDRVHAALDAGAVSPAELEVAISPPTPPATAGDELEPVDAAETLLTWPHLGMGLYVAAKLSEDKSTVSSSTVSVSSSMGPATAAVAAETAAPATGASPLATTIVQLPAARRVALLSPLAACMLTRGAHGVRGHALLREAIRNVPTRTLPAADSNAASATLTKATRALLGHMAGSGEQAERSAAYATLRTMLWLWADEARLATIGALVASCPFPNVVALLVHRLKEEFLAEAKSRADAALSPAGGASGGAEGVSAQVCGLSGGTDVGTAAVGGGTFSASAVLEIAEPLLIVPIGDRPADPLDSLDAWMAALNLTRLLLMRARPRDSSSTSGGADAAGHLAASSHIDPFVALEASRVAELRRVRLLPLDAWVRTRMDALWGEIQRAEACQPPPPSLHEMRMSFTHLHVAADVAAHTVECSAW